MAIEIAGADRKTAIALVKGDQHFQGQRLDREGDRLCAEKLGDKFVGVDFVGNERGHDVTPPQRCQLEHPETGVTPDARQGAPKRGCGPYRSAAGEAHGQPIRRQLLDALGQQMWHRLDAQHRLVESVE